MKKNGHCVSWPLIVGSLLVGCLCGIWIGAETFTIQVMVDYNSGRVKRLMRVGPILVRSEPVPLPFFDHVRVSTDLQHKTAEWHTALYLRGPFSNYSPSLQPAGVLRTLNRLDELFSRLDPEAAATIKHDYLVALSSNSVSAVKFADEIFGKMN
ncbi:MAG: hypothetical protein ACOX5G_01110 [Kiritimatiellia bacterium]|jgi:hypothetical protein